ILICLVCRDRLKLPCSARIPAVAILAEEGAESRQIALRASVTLSRSSPVVRSSFHSPSHAPLGAILATFYTACPASDCSAGRVVRRGLQSKPTEDDSSCSQGASPHFLANGESGCRG